MQEFFVWALSADGILAILGWILSDVIERMSFWGPLPADKKRLVIMVLCLTVLPLLLLSIAVLSGLSTFTKESVFLVLQAGFVAYMTSQGAHLKQLKAAEKDKETGRQLLQTYQKYLGNDVTLTSDVHAQFAYQAERIAIAGLDKGAIA